MATEETKTYALPFVTHTRSHCVWSLDPSGANVRFLDTLDPGYFESVSGTLAAGLEGDDRQRAAVAIRALYSQAQETFFALAGTLLQAPHCTYGWMSRYRNVELERVVSAISAGGPLLHLLGTGGVSWEAIAATVMRVEGPPHGVAELQGRFARFWRTSADEYLRPSHKSEYNAIKHGIRVRPGGFSLAMRPESSPGVVDPKRIGLHFPASEFGSRHITLHELGNSWNMAVGWCDRNWSPAKLLSGIQLLAMSCRNIIAYLRAHSVRPVGEWQIESPDDDSRFSKLWEPSASACEFSVREGISIAGDSLLTKEAIHAMYGGASALGVAAGSPKELPTASRQQPARLPDSPL